MNQQELELKLIDFERRIAELEQERQAERELRMSFAEAIDPRIEHEEHT